MSRREVVHVFGERRKRLALEIELLLQGKHIGELRAPVLADVAEGEVADLHPVDNERARDAEDRGSVVRAHLLVFGKDRDLVAPKQALKHEPNKLRCFGRERGRHFLTSRACHMHLDPVAPRKARRSVGAPASALGQRDELKNMGGHLAPPALYLKYLKWSVKRRGLSRRLTTTASRDCRERTAWSDLFEARRHSSADPMFERCGCAFV